MAAAVHRSNFLAMQIDIAGGIEEPGREFRIVGSEAETRTAKTVEATFKATGAVPGSRRTASGG